MSIELSTEKRTWNEIYEKLIEPHTSNRFMESAVKLHRDIIALFNASIINTLSHRIKFKFDYENVLYTYLYTLLDINNEKIIYFHSMVLNRKSELKYIFPKSFEYEKLLNDKDGKYSAFLVFHIFKEILKRDKKIISKLTYRILEVTLLSIAIFNKLMVR